MVSRGLVASGLLLAAVQNAGAAEFFVGRWSIDPLGCKINGDTSETAPLIATDTTIRWFVAHCRIGKMYKTSATAVHIQARCQNEGTKSTIPITLRLKTADRLAVMWDNGPVPDMRRCK
jgi:hypothetical protein